MVSIITCTMRDDCIDNVFNNYQKQIYKDKELIIVLNKDSMDVEKWRKRASLTKGVLIVQCPQTTSLGECLNYGIECSKYKTIAKFDDDDFYGRYYLEEALNKLEKTNAMVIGKSSFFIYFQQELKLFLYNKNREQQYVHYGKKFKSRDFLAGSTLVMDKRIFDFIKFRNLNVGEDSSFQLDCFYNNIPMYSSSKYNYTYMRYPSTHHHNSDAKDYVLKKRSHLVSQGKDLEKLVSQIESI